MLRAKPRKLKTAYKTSTHKKGKSYQLEGQKIKHKLNMTKDVKLFVKSGNATGRNLSPQPGASQRCQRPRLQWPIHDLLVVKFMRAPLCRLVQMETKREHIHFWASPYFDTYPYIICDYHQEHGTLTRVFVGALCSSFSFANYRLLPQLTWNPTTIPRPPFCVKERSVFSSERTAFSLLRAL